MAIRNDLINTEPAANLASLLSLSDERFLYCAYRTFLGRHPDPTGLDTYLPRLRKGEDKVRILRDIATSSEAFEKNLTLEGWTRPKARAFLERLVGRLYPLYLALSAHERSLRAIRAMENRLGIAMELMEQRLVSRTSSTITAGIDSGPYASQNSNAGQTQSLTPRARNLFFRLKAARELSTGNS